MFKRLYILIVSICCLSGCGIYSFTGASISPDVKTASIQYFKNYALLVQPSLAQLLTEKLKDRFISQTTLALVNNNGDLDFENTITDYKVTPLAPQTNDVAANNRLSITIKVKFTNKKDEKQNFESSFTEFVDFPSNQNLSSVELGLIDQINIKLVDDVFNKSVVNW
jgi:hypothetical protein